VNTARPALRSKPESRVSMQDIANRAGVSLKTVSRVVNNEKHVSDAVKTLVLKAIDELDYRPDATARALASRRSRRIGLIAASTTHSGPSAILDGIEKAVRNHGYSLSLVRTRPDEGYEIRDAVQQLLAQGVDGLILSEPVDTYGLDIHVPPGVPLLSLDYPDERHSPSEIVVGPDEVGGAYAATAHLLELGHATVWHIAGHSGWAATTQRIRGWKSALEDAGRPVPEYVHGDWSPASGAAAMEQLLREAKPSCVFAANDLMAIGAIHAIEKAGLTVPGDISVIGFDDIPEAAYLHTPLTTIRQDFEETAAQGVARLVEVIDGGDVAVRHFTTPVEFISRETTSTPSRNHRSGN
jgi:DNA-binding LacI/PurR family transcriptional regulator